MADTFPPTTSPLRESALPHSPSPHRSPPPRELCPLSPLLPTATYGAVDTSQFGIISLYFTTAAHVRESKNNYELTPESGEACAALTISPMGLCYREFHNGSGEKHVAAHLPGTRAPGVRLLHTHRISSGRACTCGTGLERSFRQTPASGTACSTVAQP